MKKLTKYVLMMFLSMCLCTVLFVDKVDAAGKKLSTPVITLSNSASSGKVIIEWKAVKNAQSYRVYNSTDGKNWKRISTTKKTKITNTSAETGKLYYYKVRAIASKSSLNSNYSKVKSRRCDLQRPVITLSTNHVTGKNVISWAAVPKAKKYKVYNSTDGKSWKRISTTTKTKITNTSAVAGQKYYYKVIAIASNKYANSAYSTVKSRTCQYPQESIETLSKYQSDVVNLAVEIANTWKTTYVQGEKGSKNSKGVYQFDCSGFATYVINTVMQKEIPPFRITSNLTRFYELGAVYNGGYPGEFKAQTVSFDNIQPGDVIFFSHNSTRDHCGIYIGNNQFAHSTRSNGGVKINTLKGFYKEDIYKVRRYLPTKVEPANTTKTVASTCSIYSKRENTDSKIGSLKRGSKVTVLYTGCNPESYNQAYIETSNGTKAFIYTKNLK